ncbi:NHLP leader peptide family RiPP precursor [Azospirillum sp.]|uniref:NHLP leader peptide family RiPP precursor n=1 Tax=Azospirillum sp. TaxID=34012 RepID=UPI003D716C5B
MTDIAQPLDRALARAETDADFRQRLLADPAAALAEEGAAPPAGCTVTVVADTASHAHIVLPYAPSESGPSDLSDQDLDGVAGGFIRPPSWWGAWHAQVRARMQADPASSAAPAANPPTGHTGGA